MSRWRNVVRAGVKLWNSKVAAKSPTMAMVPYSKKAAIVSSLRVAAKGTLPTIGLVILFDYLSASMSDSPPPQRSDEEYRQWAQSNGIDPDRPISSYSDEELFEIALKVEGTYWGAALMVAEIRRIAAGLPAGTEEAETYAEAGEQRQETQMDALVPACIDVGTLLGLDVQRTVQLVHALKTLSSAEPADLGRIVQNERLYARRSY